MRAYLRDYHWGANRSDVAGGGANRRGAKSFRFFNTGYKLSVNPIESSLIRTGARYPMHFETV